MESKDAHNLAELAKGSHDAFRALFIQYFPKVKYFITNLVKSESIAEDLAQDVFIPPWKSPTTAVA